MAELVHTIASYNLSWTNSSGIFKDNVDGMARRPSEYDFIKRASEPYEFWKNAIQHIANFVLTTNPSAIGFQEAGKTEDITELPMIKENYNHHINKQGPACVFTLWRKDLGDVAVESSGDLGTGRDIGRPISIIYTTKGYLLVNLHSPHSLSDDVQLTLLSDRLQPFFNRPIDLTRIFVMGDFNNPRYLHSNPLRLRQVTLTPGIASEVKSCCYSGRAPRLSEYRRGGDYCFGLNNRRPLEIFLSPVDAEGGSVASDHEMVFASFASNPDESDIEEKVQFDTLERVPDIVLGGTTGAFLVTWRGKRYVYKSGATLRHVINEYIAFQLYELVGVKVPRSTLVYAGEEPVGIILEYITGQSPMNILSHDIPTREKKMLKQAISKDYVFHALFANYDCNNSENYIVPPLGPGAEEEYYNSNNNLNNYPKPITRKNDYENTYVIDCGGSLFYRAKGITKDLTFTTKSVPEIDSIASKTRDTRAKLFIDLANSSILKHRVVCERWRSIDPSIIPRFLMTPAIQSLLIKFEMTELTKIMKGRIEAIHKYCADATASSTLTEVELLELAADIGRNIQTYRGSANGARIQEKLKGKTEVLAQEFDGRLLLVQAYDKNPTLFRELLAIAPREALNAFRIRGATLLRHVIDKEDYDTIIQLLLKYVRMSVDDMNLVDIARILREIGRISPKHQLFGRVHVAPFEPIPSSDILRDREYSIFLPLTQRNSVFDKQMLVKKPIRGYKEWIKAQEEYLKSDPRITAIVRAYTFRGDKLANSYLRKTLDNPYDILNAIRGDTVVPFAYQIYDNYDFLVGKGLTMPAKETLMMDDGKTIHHANIHALFLANFDYFLRLPNLYTLMKDYCRELLKIIQNAPRAPDDVFLYRGIQNENHMKPGTYEYVSNSFTSTSLDPYVAAGSSFTSPYLNTPISFCVYEIELKFGTPCIFLNSVSHFPEDEILLPYNLLYRHSIDITLKYLCPRVEEFTVYTDPRILERMFVRSVSVHGFSGRTDPKVFNVGTTKKTIKKTYLTKTLKSRLRKRNSL